MLESFYNTIFVIGVISLPSILFTVIGMFLNYKGKVHLSWDEEDKGAVILLIVAFIISFGCGFLFFKILPEQPVEYKFIFVYALLQIVGSWVTLAFTWMLTYKAFEIRNLHYKQKEIFGTDLNDVGEGRYFVYLHESDWKAGARYLRLYKTVLSSDSSGSYIVAERIKTFDEETFTSWTKDNIKSLLKDYFEVQRLFYVSDESASEPIIIDVDQNKKPEVLFLK